MKQRRRTYALLAVLALLMLSAGLAAAQSGGVYSLSWGTVDGGGGAVAGGAYALAGAAGQPDAGALNGGAYALTSGFWGGIGVTEHSPPTSTLYLPLVMKK